ncbi:transporter [Halpernia frigidisoli]|uniref:Putative MetA-pathway of phenol degradation n=1 Tax=Halpernia frigidisoli TaxID=1125876 RepID=A0A1I3IY55_9FLAO|nr:transporter [Halpernia frigidisoli]SFI52907.1 Putative MetA-pathway of phenol degradation [Halpernia frigidisoli]
MKNIFLLTFLCSNFIFFKAQEKIELDRPDQTETSATVPLHYFQMENGYVYEQINKVENSQQFPGILFKYGIGESTELRLITQFNFDKIDDLKKNKFQPITLGFKTNLIKGKNKIPNISFLGHLSFFAKDDNGRNRIIPEFKFLFDYNLFETVSLGYNLGMEWDNNLNENYTYTFTIAKAVSPKLNIFVEAYGFVSPIISADHRLDGGFTYFLSNNSAIDLSAGKGLSKFSPDYFVSFGYSFRINLKK